MRSSWTKCHKKDSPCASYQDHARRRIQASRNVHPVINLILIVFNLARTFSDNMVTTTPPCQMCNDKRGLGAPPKPDVTKKVSTTQRERGRYSNHTGSLSTMPCLRLVFSLDERQRQILSLHHWPAGRHLCTYSAILKPLYSAIVNIIQTPQWEWKTRTTLK